MSTMQRRLGLLNATTINMSNMVGIGPFIAIALILKTLGGPQAYLAWVVGTLIALADGLVVAELGAARPAAGGTYVFLREGFGARTWGRMLAFLFVWQILFAGPAGNRQREHRPGPVPPRVPARHGRAGGQAARGRHLRAAGLRAVIAESTTSRSSCSASGR